MLDIISKELRSCLMTFPRKKKLAFLILLYGRMLPELMDFFLSENQDFSLFENAYEYFNEYLKDEDVKIDLEQLKDEILNATPDSENYPTLAASFAMNAALVGVVIASYILNPQDSHIAEAMKYVRESLTAKIISEKGALVYNRALEEYVQKHALFQNEKRVEENDIVFLCTLEDSLTSTNAISKVLGRAATQGGLFSG